MDSVDLHTILVTGGSGFVGRTLIPLLSKSGYVVRALARSAEAAQKVAALGAEPVIGDIGDAGSLAAAVQGADAVVHLAAHVQDWGRREEFSRVNIDGTRQLLEAARASRVRRFVHISTEAVLLDGTSLVRADESRPIPSAPIGLYPWSKALSEKLVVAADSAELRTVVLRPRLIWGPGDTTLTPRLAEAMRKGQFAWIEKGTVLTSTCHVRNLCEAILRALDRDQAQGVYFVTDGPPIEVRDFLSALVRPLGVSAPDRSMPRWLALGVARMVEAVWRMFGLRGTPPVTRTAVLLMGNEMTVDDTRIRRELSYLPAITREEGLAELAQQPLEPYASGGAEKAALVDT